MALNKQNLTINFSKGLDSKTDPFQVPAGNFLSLVNSVFDIGGQLTKRNGFGQLTSLPDLTSKIATTYFGNLLAIGENIQVLSADTNTWFNRGSIQPLELDVIPVVRTNTSQLTVDTAVAANGLACTVWYDSDTTSYYRITDSVTGGVVVNTTALTADPAATQGPRVIVLGSYFIILFVKDVAGLPHLRYIGIPTNLLGSVTTEIDVTNFTNLDGFDAAYDCYEANNNLYIAAACTGSTIKVTYLPSTLATPPVLRTLTSVVADNISITADESGSTPIIWITYYDDTLFTLKTTAFNFILNITPVLAETVVLAASGTLSGLTSIADAGLMTAVYSNNNTYSYTPNAPATPGDRSDYTTYTTVTQAGVVSAPSNSLRSVALASKPVFISNEIHVLVVYGGVMQPTYFLVSLSGNIVAKLAGSEGAGYPSSTVLPAINLDGETVQIGYLFKAQTTPVNKSVNATQVLAIYAQQGINIVKFNLDPERMITAEIGGSLQLAGGFMWQYDGAKPVEQGFHLFPEDIGTSTVTGAGSITANTYFYSACYEWTDAQGIIHRSAPSVPVTQVTTTASSTNTIKVPTLRLTYKTGINNVRIVIYRYSVAQPIFYQITSVTSPIDNDITVDSISFVDTLADSAIIGNTILYTTGGIVENISAPAVTSITPFKSRLFAIDAEDRNVLWFSKQVIQATPVEMSDLFTIYVAPTIGAQGDTGDMQCLSAMDDKLIIFKQNAIYYITGTGPDNTGANNDFSQPTFITSTVGCANQSSIVFIPAGLMFQSDKGIWLLNRSLGFQYIGAPVESYTNNTTVVAANNIPGTNQVRFKLSDGVTLMYDYYYEQWGTFSGIGAISSTLYEGLETYINARGEVFQETEGLYLDGSHPVLMSFTTSWLNLAGLQGYERAYYFYFLGQYKSPHKLNIGMAYDYNPSSLHSTLITPTNTYSVWGGNSLWGGGPAGWGGGPSLEQWRIHFQTQLCQSFQISIQEIYDPSQGVPPGAGLTLSGLDVIVGIKRGYKPQRASNSAG